MPLFAIVAAIVVSLCWGGNFSAARFSMMDFPPFLTILLRFVFVGVVLAPFALRHKWPDLRDMAFLAFSNIILHFAFIFLAMSKGLNITSAIVATQLGVPFSCLFAAILYKDYLGPWRCFGLGVAFIGVVFIAGTPNAAEHAGPFALAIFGALAWSAANIYLKRMKPVPIVSILFWPAIISLPPLLLMTAFFESGQIAAMEQAHAYAWWGIAYSAVFSSLVGYGLWNWLMLKYPLSQVAPYSLLTPVTGIACGVVIFAEPLTMRIVMGSILTIIGVGVITLRRPKLAELEKM